MGDAVRLRVLAGAIGAQYLLTTLCSLTIIARGIAIAPAVGTAVVIANQIPSLAAPPAVGAISDRFGRMWVLIAGTVVLLIPASLLAVKADPVLLFAESFCVGTSFGIWASVGTAALLDVAERRGERTAQRSAVILGWVIDGGKLIGSCCIALLASRAGVLAFTIVVVSILAVGYGASISPNGKPRRDGTAEGRAFRTPALLIAAGFAVIGFASGQQSAITVLASRAMTYGLAASGISWALGAIAGTGFLLAFRDLRTIHLAGSPVFYAAGFAGLALGGVFALIGIGLIGCGSAVTWQAYRGMILSRIPIHQRGTYAGLVLTVAVVSQTVGSALLIGLPKEVAGIPVFAWFGAAELLGIVPFAIGCRAFLLWEPVRIAARDTP